VSSRSARQQATDGTRRDALWAAMRNQRRFSINSAGDGAQVARSTAKSYVQSLVAGGVIVFDGMMTSAKGFPEKAYTFTADDVSVAAPRVRKDGAASRIGAVQDQIWRTIKMLKVFTVHELAVEGSTEEVRVRPDTAIGYLRILAAAGYLVAEGRGKAIIYRVVPTLCRGPEAPVVQDLQRVYDPNRRKVVWEREVTA